MARNGYRPGCPLRFTTFDSLACHAFPGACVQGMFVKPIRLLDNTPAATKLGLGFQPQSSAARLVSGFFSIPFGWWIVLMLHAGEKTSNNMCSRKRGRLITQKGVSVLNVISLLRPDYSMPQYGGVAA